MLKNGEQVEVGTYRELTEAQGIFHKMVLAQQLENAVAAENDEEEEGEQQDYNNTINAAQAMH